MLHEKPSVKLIWSARFSAVTAASAFLLRVTVVINEAFGQKIVTLYSCFHNICCAFTICQREYKITTLQRKRVKMERSINNFAICN